MEYFRHIAQNYLGELYRELNSLNIRELETIYIGGGTPTALDDDLFEELLNHIYPYTLGVKEYTVEANCENLSEQKLIAMKKYGVNRLSLGVESTNDEILKTINRHHTYRDVINSISLARKCGFDNINVDLIMGLPGVSLEDLKLDIANILALNVEHISTYSLIVEKNTVFFNKDIKEKTDEEERTEYDLVDEILRQNGFVHYEVSNFAKKGKESVHNLTYWKDEHYYGIGLGASSYVNGIRRTNTRSITSYLKGQRILEEEIVTSEDDEQYFAMLNLRTVYGIDDEIYARRFGHSFIEKHRKTLAQFAASGDLIIEESKVKPTYRGMMILDFIFLKLFS